MSPSGSANEAAMALADVPDEKALRDALGIVIGLLSVKAVDHHVSAVLAKLGVPTRAATRRVAQSA